MGMQTSPPPLLMSRVIRDVGSTKYRRGHLPAHSGFLLAIYTARWGIFFFYEKCRVILLLLFAVWRDIIKKKSETKGGGTIGNKRKASTEEFSLLFSDQRKGCRFCAFPPRPLGRRNRQDPRDSRCTKNTGDQIERRKTKRANRRFRQGNAKEILRSPRARAAQGKKDGAGTSCQALAQRQGFLRTRLVPRTAV